MNVILISFYCRITESQEDHLTLFPALVTSEGNVTWMTQRIFVTYCDLDLQLFPWDKQKCFLTLGSWIHNEDRLEIFNLSHKADTNHYYASGEWHLESASLAKISTSYFSSGNKTYSRIECTLKIARKQWFYVINFVFPVGCLMLTTVLVFLLPSGGGEKIGMSVTLLLPTMVYLLLVDSWLPSQSDVVPLLSK